MVLVFSKVRTRHRGGRGRYFGGNLFLKNAGSGFTLPANIGDLGPTVSALFLSECELIGCAEYTQTQSVLGQPFMIKLHRVTIAGKIPASLGHLINLTRLDLRDNRLGGEIRWLLVFR